ncbi:hypothetical protein LCGC14_1674880 [marine sediment metagenome]|uniref:Uncharacterized protein n=1 Tax=marine sediment metagenome TaxID=412755 RepID=A0A0F9HR48_9ZZZZ
MGKGKGLLLIIIGLGLAVLFTWGALIDVILDGNVWRYFVAIPIWLIFVIISLILIFVGVLSFSKTSMMEKMFLSMFKEIPETAKNANFDFETFIKTMFKDKKD